MDPESLLALMKLEQRNFEKKAELYRLAKLARPDTPRLHERFLGTMKALRRSYGARLKPLDRPIVTQRTAYR